VSSIKVGLGEADRIVVRGARVFDPQVGLDRVTDILIEDGVISSIGDLSPSQQAQVISGKGWLVVPGLYDMHVHLREPGQEHKETVRTGCAAAMAGGFTGVACMPNTDPPIDSPGVVRFIREQATGLPVEVYPVGCVTKGRAGKTLADMAELAVEGVTAFSDDGAPVATAGLMRRALEYAAKSGAVIVEHAEEPSLTSGGVMHESAASTRFGLPGWPAVGEEICIARDIALAEYTGGRLHIAHVSTAGSVALIREAKRRGIAVTAEVTPHHLTLTCELLSTYDSDYKVNPPLRESRDSEALLEGLLDGTIDAIATDHAPHARDEKEVELISAPFGMLGLETALGVILTKFVQTNRLPLERLIDAMTVQPRRIMGLPPVRIEPGARANLTLIAPNEDWVVDRSQQSSKSINTPFHGWELRGRAKGVILGQQYYLA